ncbi:MAG: aldo/keto reductase [Meiothermus sp.]|uniref:aldo/keto reductase n=1 Tax=Meiothermus sp. TaxID=1955249 RepID=UPI0025EEEDC0|nr:aldo/keto reductase [Meiothermus sp.]MCS7068647.1 aldo/keto reductase [Meiothermus sp.]MDW8424608.1 aldo/keto reductase [Meiothermus sp.]
MEQRQLGKSGLKVSLVGLGCNNFGGRVDVDGSQAVIRKALDLGITLFDTADTYGNRGGSESILGNYLGSERENIVLATKFGWEMGPGRGGASRQYIYKALAESLKRLKTDYIDLYQLHKPDPHTPLEETLSTLNDLVRQGMVRYVGCSNLPAWQVVEAHWIAKQMGFEGFISCQDEYSLLARKVEAELLPAMQHLGLGLLPYFPLASGLLTGKYRRDGSMPEDARLARSQQLAQSFMTEQNLALVEKLESYSKSRGRTLLELAFGWLASNPVVSSVIAGATKPEQVVQNVKAVEWKMSDVERNDVRSILDA